MSKCCFCGKDYLGYGNDISPIMGFDNPFCCDECNRKIVIPTRSNTRAPFRESKHGFTFSKVYNMTEEELFAHKDEVIDDIMNTVSWVMENDVRPVLHKKFPKVF